LNNAEVRFNANIDPSQALSLNGIPFERNELVVTLSKLR